MNKKHLHSIILVLLMLGLRVSFATEPPETAGVKRERPPANFNKLPTVSLGIGNLSFFGDISGNIKGFPYTNFRKGYNLKVEERFGSCLGVSLNGLYGRLEENQKSVIPARNLNFQTKIYQGDLNLVFYFDNNFMLNRASRFAPYIFGGVGYMSFDPKADLKDRSGNTYFYWTDGTIRDKAQTEQNLGTAHQVNRDYVYETTLKRSYIDSLTYQKTTITIPFGGGIRFKFSDKFNANLSATYYMTQTKYLDNLKGKNYDGFLYSSLSFGYNIGVKKAPKEPSVYDNVDFSAVDKEDDDADGVKNIDDLCPGTPKGVQVDAHGCPLDSDGDGIPDYIDREPNTAKGAVVNGFGETITDESAEKNAGDTTAVSRDIIYKAYPSQKLSPGSSESSSAKPAADLGEFKIADTNNDGRISAEEITNAIDAFFDGDKKYSPAFISKLIDFFFDQE